LPEEWNADRKEREMHVPEWLLNTIYRCLQKKPFNRFPNGIRLHEFIVNNSLRTEQRIERAGDELNGQQAENDALRTEVQQLKEQVRQLQQAPAFEQREPVAAPAYAAPEYAAPQPKRNNRWGYILLLLAGLSAVVYAVVQNRGREGTAQREPVREEPKRSIGQYKVLSARTYFHNDADPATKRTAYMIPSNDVVTATDEKNGFVYTEFTNSRGQTSKGWVKKTDLITLEEWTLKAQTAKAQPRPAQEDINLQLAEARKLLQDNDTKAALYIYSYLAEQGVPEAMYEFGNLGLRGKNTDIGCDEAYAYVQRASEKDYAPAKRTLGFLYLFADNKDVLQISNYDHCNYERNVFKGTRLLVEAVTGGDTTAQRLLQEIRLNKPDETADTTGQ
jgi:serine/threonine-protein kinase